MRTPHLTDRQLEVLEALARGLPNKAIARELGIAVSTVKVHLGYVFTVLRVTNRTEAAIAYHARHGIRVAPGPDLPSEPLRIEHRRAA